MNNKYKSERQTSVKEVPLSVCMPVKGSGQDNPHGRATNERGANRVGQLYCSVCERRNRESAASKFCMECREYYCLDCVAMHGFFPALATHTLVRATSRVSDAGNRVSEPGQPVRHLPTERCPRHPEKLVDMYCKNHDVVACSICFLPHYKLCNDIHYVPDIEQVSSDDISVTKGTSDLDTVADNLGNVVKSCRKITADLQAGKVAGVKTITEFRNYIVQIIDELEKSTIEQMEGKHKELETSILAEVSKAESLANTVKERQSLVRATNANPSTRFVNQVLARQITAEADNLVKSIVKSTSKFKLVYTNDASVTAYMNGLKSLGNIRDHKKQRGTLKSKMVYDIKTDEDSDQCNIWGSCLTGNGDILLADNNNNKLKLLDKNTYKVIGSCSLPASPRSLYKVNASEVAVSLSNKSVAFISTVKGLKVRSSRQLEHNCFGLALTEGEMYISDGSLQVYEYDLGGTLLRVISQDPNGEPLFSESRDITISDDGRKIHVADSRKGLVTVNKEGKILWRYTGSELKGAYGVCTDGDGNLLVTGILSHNVLQFGTNGEKLEVVGKSDEVQNPVSVCYDRHNERILVTKNGNFLFVFDFDS